MPHYPYHPRCPECDLSTFPPAPHRCGVPILREAIGLPLTPIEERHIRWLAGGERETVKVIAGLFRRVREEQAKEPTMTPTSEEIATAAAQLATSTRGLQAMSGLYDWLEAYGTGLGADNQWAVLTLLQGAWGPLAGTTRELIADEIGVDR